MKSDEDVSPTREKKEGRKKGEERKRKESGRVNRDDNIRGEERRE